MNQTKSMMEKQERIKQMLRLESNGYSVKEIAYYLRISIKTVYRYKQEIKINSIDSILFKIRNEFLKTLDINKSIEILLYSELSIIRTKFSLYGNTKAKKLKAVKEYLKPYLYFGLNPKEMLSRNQLKQQYFKMAKSYHPDSNKQSNSKVFIEFHNCYEYLQSICWI